MMYLIQRAEREWRGPLEILTDIHEETAIPRINRVGHIPAMAMQDVQSIVEWWESGTLAQYWSESDMTPPPIPDFSTAPARLEWLLNGMTIWGLERNVFTFADDLMAKMCAVAKQPSAAFWAESAMLLYDHQEHANARYIELPEELAGEYGYSALLLWHYTDEATQSTCLVQSWFQDDLSKTKTFVVPLDKRASIGECMVASSQHPSGVECHNFMSASADERLVMFGLVAHIASCKYNIFGVSQIDFPAKKLEDSIKLWSVHTATDDLF